MIFAKGAVERIIDLCAGQMDAAGTVAPLERAAVLTSRQNKKKQATRGHD